MPNAIKCRGKHGLPFFSDDIYSKNAGEKPSHEQDQDALKSSKENNREVSGRVMLRGKEGTAVKVLGSDTSWALGRARKSLPRPEDAVSLASGRTGQ